MFSHRISNGLSSGRKQQTAVKRTVDRPKPQTNSKDTVNHRHHPYASPPINSHHRIITEDTSWSKPSVKIFSDTPELNLTCQEDPLTEAQLKNHPTQAYDPTVPLPLPAVRKRTAVIKKLTPQEIEFFQDPDEDFIPSESDDDDDDDESYLPEHDRRPYNRSNHLNSTLSRGRARGGRGNSNSMTNRVPPSTHFVRPQPDTLSDSRPKLYSVNNHRATPVELELQRSYSTTLLRFYGTRNGQTINSNDYGNFRIKCSICNEQSSNNMSFIAHLCSHFEDDLHYISPFDKVNRQCSVCQAEFATPYQALLHKDQEHMIELKEFSCRICQQTHSNLIDLFTHLNTIHVGIDMPYNCDRCHYRTSMYEDLTHHIRQVHKDTQYFFCPYCLQAVYLPSIGDSNLLNSTPAVRHVILHFDRIENSNQKQRRTESAFKFCDRCVLHVKSLKEHSNVHHSFNAGKIFLNDDDDDDDDYEDDENQMKHHHSNNENFNHRSYPVKFDRINPLPMATIRRRLPSSTNYESIALSNRWYSRR